MGIYFWLKYLVRLGILPASEWNGLRFSVFLVKASFISWSSPITDSWTRCLRNWFLCPVVDCFIYILRLRNVLAPEYVVQYTDAIHQCVNSIYLQNSELDLHLRPGLGLGPPDWHWSLLISAEYRTIASSLYSKQWIMVDQTDEYAHEALPNEPRKTEKPKLSWSRS